MTFDQLVADVCGRMNLVSDEAITRVGQAINRHYRRVTASIGLEATRHVIRSGNSQLGSAIVTFATIEKIDRVIEVSADGSRHTLTPQSVDVVRTGHADANEYAVINVTSHSVSILLGGAVNNTTIRTFEADGWMTLGDLVGTDEPTLPASFHDILIFAVVGEEHLRKEKPQLADRFTTQSDALLRELRFTLADAPAIDRRQAGGIFPSSSGASSGQGSGGAPGTPDYIQTGKITFDRDPLPPFEVTPGSAKVANLDADLLDGQDSLFYRDADKLDGQHGAFYQDAGNLNAGTLPVARIADDSITFAKLPNVTASRLLGRGAAAGAGDPQELSLGTNLSITGTVLNAAVPAPTPPGGADKQVQFNDGGAAFGGNANLTFDKATGVLSALTAIALGVNPAAGSLLRLPNAATINARNGANSADVPLIGLDAGNSIYIGAAGNRVVVPATLAVNGGSILFPAVPVPSAGVNDLDDYREGTWTPRFGASGGISGDTYGTQVGSYIKIGKLVVAWFQATLTNKGTMAGSMSITGLPFTVGLSLGHNAVAWDATLINLSFVCVLPIAGGTTASIRGAGGGGAGSANSPLQDTTFGNNTSIFGMVIYIAQN